MRLTSMRLILIFGCFFLESGQCFVAPQHATEGLILRFTERTNVGQIADYAYRYATCHKARGLLIGDREPHMDWIRMSWRKKIIFPEFKSCFDASHFKSDACLREREREVGIVPDVEINYQQLSTTIALPIFASPVAITDPLLHRALLQLNRSTLDSGLSFNGSKGIDSGNDATQSDDTKSERSPRSQPCIEESTSLHIACMLFFGFGLGGLCWSILMAFRVNYKRPILAAALIIPGALCACCAPVWWFSYCMIFPKSFGLPPSWLPQKWHQCQQSQSDHNFPHAENVSLKLFWIPVNVVASPAEREIIQAGSPYVVNTHCGPVWDAKGISVVDFACDEETPASSHIFGRDYADWHWSSLCDFVGSTSEHLPRASLYVWTSRIICQTRLLWKKIWDSHIERIYRWGSPSVIEFKLHNGVPCSRLSSQMESVRQNPRTGIPHSGLFCEFPAALHFKESEYCGNGNYYSCHSYSVIRVVRAFKDFPPLHQFSGYVTHSRWCGGILCAVGTIVFIFGIVLLQISYSRIGSWLDALSGLIFICGGVIFLHVGILPFENYIVSQKLLTLPSLPYYNKYMANVLPTDKQIAIISSLCEGSSIRSIERVTGVHRDTIMRLGVRVGQKCTVLMDEKMRNLDCHRLEMDEIWGYVGKKERHLKPGDDPTLGNVWTYCAIDADTKLVPTFKVAGDRDVKTTTAFVMDVADRMKNRVQISTDGLKAYVDAMALAFDGDVDYGQIIKSYGTETSVESQRRYSAPKITASEKKVIFGRPDFDLISTSYVERLNATTRLHMKRLARLTHAFSKKRENFEAAVGLHFAHYNFVRRHNTLRCTPAMAAGVEKSFWSVGELLEAAA